MEDNEKKQWGIMATEYYSTIKKNETIPCAATWMNLEIPNGNQVRQKEKTNTSVHMEKHTLFWQTCRLRSHQVSLHKTLSLQSPRFGELSDQKTGVEVTYLLLRLLLEWGQGFPLWGHLSPLGASHSCPELSSCRRRKQGASGI